MHADYNDLNQITARSGGGIIPVRGKVSKPSNIAVNGKAANIETNNVPWKFWAHVPVEVGTNQFTVVAKDGGGHSITNTYQMVVSGGTAGAYTYDLNGNTLSDGARTYTWDAENRLISVTGSNGTSAFTYDGQGRRVKETVNGSLSKIWIWNGNSIAEERSANGTTTKRFFSQGEQVNGTAYYYTRDHLGSIREMTDTSGNIVARYAYDAYGRATKLTGTVDSDFGYTGHYYHAASGLNLTLYRAYDPDTARWLSRDPLENPERKQGPNLYAYVSNSPLNFIDEFGLAKDQQCLDDCWDKLMKALGYTGEGALIGGSVGLGLQGLNKTAPKTAAEQAMSRTLGNAPNEGWTSWTRRACGRAGRNIGRAGLLPAAGIGAVAGGSAVIGFSLNLYIDCVKNCPDKCPNKQQDSCD